MSELELDVCIGEGVQGKIYTVKGENNIVVKISTDEYGMSGEVEILTRLQHIPGVPRLIDHISDRKFSMEYCDGNFVGVELDKEKVIEVCRQLLETLREIHELDIIHGDIKESNIMYKSWDSSDFRVILGDFGFSGDWYFYKKWYDISSGNCLPSMLLYKAPEILEVLEGYTSLKKDIITPKLDIWALGCTLLTLTSGDNPPYHLHEIARCKNDGFGEGYEDKLYTEICTYHQSHSDIKRKIYEDGFLHGDDELIDLVAYMLLYDSEERWSAEQLLSHPIFLF